MTTDNRPPLPGFPQHEVEAYQQLVETHLACLRAWTTSPDERTDWALEQLLDELSAAAKGLRRLRGDAEVPF